MFPTALSISVNTEKAYINFANNAFPKHSFVADDSRCIEKGNPRTSWLHARRDGSPDRRYSYNPRNEYRTDLYEYGLIKIDIAGKTTIFTVSSKDAVSAFKKIGNAYSKGFYVAYDPIPDFLSLIKILDGRSELVEKIEALHEKEKSNTTITGGDPMAQSEDLQKLLTLLRRISRDILVYTGYQKEELTEEQLKNIAVLIDGEYIEERNTNCILRGSDDQRIYVLDEALGDKYKKYCATYKNQIQNFMTADGVISVGIHRPGFIHELNETVSEKGLNNM